MGKDHSLSLSGLLSLRAILKRVIGAETLGTNMHTLRARIGCTPLLQVLIKAYALAVWREAGTPKRTDALRDSLERRGALSFRGLSTAFALRTLLSSLEKLLCIRT